MRLSKEGSKTHTRSYALSTTASSVPQVVTRTTKLKLCASSATWMSTSLDDSVVSGKLSTWTYKIEDTKSTNKKQLPNFCCFSTCKWCSCTCGSLPVTPSCVWTVNPFSYRRISADQERCGKYQLTICGWEISSKVTRSLLMRLQYS